MNQSETRALPSFNGKRQIIIHKKHFENMNKLYIDGKTKIKYGKNSKFILNDTLSLGYNAHGNNGRSTVIHLEEEARFIVNGSARIFYGGDILLFQGSEFIIGNSFINSDCMIRGTKKIAIGDGCAISCKFIVFDSNFHEINGVTMAKPVIIEDDVWIGARVTVLPGVVIGRGSVIAAGSVVNKNIPPESLAAGVPAKVIKENIEWKM